MAGTDCCAVQVEHTVVDVPDLLPELSLARAAGRRLLGAEPGEALGTVPAGRVREHAREGSSLVGKMPANSAA